MPGPEQTTGHHAETASRLGRLTLYALAAFGLGLAFGLLWLRDAPAGHPALSVAEGIVRAWTNAFQLLVVPFIASHLYLAIAATRLPPAEVGRIGLLAPVVFLVLLVAVFLMSFGVTGWLMTSTPLAGLTLDPGAAPPPASPPRGGADWVDGFIPPNLIASLGTGSVLPVMIFTVAFALAARRLAHPQQEGLERGVRAVAQVMLVMVEWLILLTPLIMLALGVTSGARSGIRIGGALLAFTALMSGVLLLALVALYPVATLGGRVPLRRLARALWPAQMTALATRSSLATLPALMAGAESVLGLPRAHAGYVLPLAGAVLKLSRGVSEPVTLLFLAGALGIRLDLEQLVVFTAGQILLTPTTLGVPRVTSGTRSMPLYVAVGIPPEYVVLLAATTAVTDVLMTVLNSTGYMTAAVLVNRLAPGGGAAADGDG